MTKRKLKPAPGGYRQYDHTKVLLLRCSRCGERQASVLRDATTGGWCCFACYHATETRGLEVRLMGDGQ